MLSCVFSVSSKGTPAADWDRNTWPELEKLARHHPEAGIHFQGMSNKKGTLLITLLIIYPGTAKYTRLKDVKGITGDWFAELLKREPWFKDTLPNVSCL